MAVAGPKIGTSVEEVPGAAIVRTVYQGLSIVRNVGGQGRHIDVERFKRCEGERRIKIGTSVGRERLFLGGADTPLASTERIGFPESLAKLQPQEYRIVIGGTGADGV